MIEDTIQRLLADIRALEDKRDVLVDLAGRLEDEVERLAGCLQTAERERAVLEEIVRKLSGSGEELTPEEHTRARIIREEPEDSPDVMEREFDV